MKNSELWALALAACVAGVSGCGSEDASAKADPSAIEAAFGAGPAAVAEEPAETAEETTTESVVIPVDADGEVRVQEVAARAATAIRKDDVTEAMVMLQTLRRARNLSPDQLTTVQDQMAALQSDLANRAAEGDQRAQQALNLIRQSTRW